MKLYKLSSPGWEKDFQTENELKQELFTPCRSGFATPTETFYCFNSFRNLSNGIINPVTLH